MALGKNAATYLIMATGIPFTYAGFETGQAGAYPNYNRDPLWPERWIPTEMSGFLGTLNKFRNGVINKDGDTFLTGAMKFLFTAGNALAFMRGEVLVFLTNVGSQGVNVAITTSDTGFPSGTEMVDVLSNSTVTVGPGGILTVTLTHGQPMVLYPKNGLNQLVMSTKLTGSNTTSSSSSNSSSTTTSGSDSNTSSSSSSAGKKSSATTVGGDMAFYTLFTISIAFCAGLLL
jgi:alpha-amylase